MRVNQITTKVVSGFGLSAMGFEQSEYKHIIEFSVIQSLSLKVFVILPKAQSP